MQSGNGKVEPWSRKLITGTEQYNIASIDGRFFQSGLVKEEIIS